MKSSPFTKVYASLLISTSTLLMQPVATAATYDFQDPKGVNHIVFMLDAPLEFISGTGRGISGTVDFDPTQPEALSGQILLATDSLEVPNDLMRDHMLGEKWLDAEQYGQITFTINSFSVETQNEHIYQGTAEGTLSLRGHELAVTVPTRINYVEDGAARREGQEGDLIVVRADFTVQLSDIGIELNAAQALKVANEVQIKVVVAGRTAE